MLCLSHRYEKQLQQEEEAFQQQRRRLYNEVQDEKDRLASNASRQRQELDALRRQLEDSHRLALSAMKEQFEKAREEQERRHAVSLVQFKMVSVHSEKPICSPHVSQTFPQHCLRNSASVYLIDDGPLSAFQGKSSGTSCL